MQPGSGIQICDVAVITVIGPELRAMLKGLGVAGREPETDSGNEFWIVEVPNKSLLHRPLRVVVHAIGMAGEAPAGNATTWVRNKFEPAAAILSGISAGRRNKVKIGDVVLSRAVVDHSVEVAIGGGRMRRLSIPPLPHAMQQMLASYDLDKSAFQQELEQLFGGTPKPPRGVGEPLRTEWLNHLNTSPRIEDAEVASANLLLRDSELLEDLVRTAHQGIKVGDMEAGGFVQACVRDTIPTCWLVVRSVSDFGDDLKSDDFHKWASCAAAAWVSRFLREGFRLQTIRDIDPPSELAKLTRLSEIGRNDAGFVQRSHTADGGEIRLEALYVKRTIEATILDFFSRGGQKKSLLSP